MKFKTTKVRVRELLLVYPHLRDDDNQLMASFWKNELDKLGLSPSSFLYHYSVGRLTMAGSIERSRQKLQEEEPKLRGERYKERHGIQVKESLEELNYKTDLFN